MPLHANGQASGTRQTRTWLSKYMMVQLTHGSKPHVLQLAASCRKLPQVVVSGRGKLRQVAASCRARQLAASCRKLPRKQLAATCRKLPRLDGEQLAASIGNLPQGAAESSCARSSRQVAATCRKLPQVARTASCRKLPQVAAAVGSRSRQVAASYRKLPRNSVQWHPPPPQNSIAL